MLARLIKWLQSLKYNRKFIAAFVNKSTEEKAWFYECAPDESHEDGYYLRLPNLSEYKVVTRHTDEGGSIYIKPYWHPKRIVEHMAESGYEQVQKLHK